MNQAEFSRLLQRYVLGFGLSLVLSVGSYLVVAIKPATDMMLMATVLLLAVIQLVVQLVCFLHLDIRGRSVGRTITLAYTLLMMLVIVLGSLWIMHNLDYRMGMSGEAMNEYMKQQNKKGF